MRIRVIVIFRRAFLGFLFLPFSGAAAAGERAWSPSPFFQVFFSALSGEEAEKEEWRQLFERGERLVLEGRMNEAERVFIEIIRMGASREQGSEEIGSPSNWFFRLNRTQFQRFAVRANLARGGQVLGTGANRLFSYFGMPDAVTLSNRTDAYDAAILYWQEISILDGDGLQFSGDLEALLLEERGHPAEEILAFGIAGFPLPLVRRIFDYVENEPADPAVDSFILQVINRYVPAVPKLPGLVEPMTHLTGIVGGRLADTMGSPDERLRVIQRQAHILGRLDDPERVSRLLNEEMTRNREGGAAEIWASLALALRLEDTEKGALLFDQLWGLSDESLPVTRMELNGARLHLTEINLGSSDTAEAAGEYLADYARFVLGGSAPAADLDAFLLHAFWWEPNFPNFNPYLADGVVGALAHLLPVLSQRGGVDSFLSSLQSRPTEEERNLEAMQRQIAFLSACVHWWHGDQVEALAILRKKATEEADPPFLFLLASLEARLFYEVEPLLRKLSSEPDTVGYNAAVFLYLLGGQWGRFELLREGAERILSHSLSVRRKEQWAIRFLEDSLYWETAELLERVAALPLERAEEQRFAGVTLRYSQRVGRAREKVSLARDFLISRPPVTLQEWNTLFRQSAIELLSSAGELEAYRREVSEAGTSNMPLRSRLLLVAESKFLTEREKGRLSPLEIQDRMNEVKDLLEQALAEENADDESRLDYGEWLIENGYYHEAAALFDEILQRDPVALFVDHSLLFGAYEGAGRLVDLVSFFDDWEMPYASSIDAFYGLQPTSHILENLGARLQRDAGGNPDRSSAASVESSSEERQAFMEAAVRAWTHAVRLNPVIFTEGTRVALVNQLATEGRLTEVLSLIEDFLFREASDPERFVVNPFSSVLPPWLDSPRGRDSGRPSTLSSLLQAVDDRGMTGDLINEAESWLQAGPDDFSRQGFFLLMLARTQDASFRSKWDLFLDSGRFLLEEAKPEHAGAFIQLLLPNLEGWEAGEAVASEIRGLSY